VNAHHLTLVEAIRLLTLKPAQVLGLAGGRFAKGEPADLVLFDVERAWKVDPAKLRSKAKNTVFDGRPVQGKVLRTMVAGAAVFAPE